MQTMAELGFHFGILEGHQEVVHVPLYLDSSLFIFLDGSAIHNGEKTMTVIPDIWDDLQRYGLANSLPIKLRREVT
ncbi:MAG: hypothetical protein IPL59_10565 [Candidatus Competibacteraceae bacterium]|nr:hypothetical protein [Candidatus Competibacteraceae bacterium]